MGRKKLTIQLMQEVAAARGGRCLSPVYVNAYTKLLWQCARGHEWMALPLNVQRGSWCPNCAGRGRTIQDMQQLAAQKGGQCLSDTYVRARSKLLWECAKGHQWMATPDNIERRSWCPECYGNVRLTIQEMHSLAESRGGKCLTETYFNNRGPLLWECKEGHRWKTTGHLVKNGAWCPYCAGHGKPSMDDIQHLAKERGGKLLSQDYRNARTHLQWECKDGHQWTADWDKVRQGQWCPECSTGLGERICREFFSQLFQNPFPKTRPEWLVNKAGNQMELDGYCATLGIAFEHQGEQHYSTKTRFIDTEAVLAKRQEDDALKSELCIQRGITLVSVPEIPNRLPLDQVKTFMKEQLAIKGVPLPQDTDTRDVDINRAYRTGGSRETLNYLRAIALNHGGKCLSEEYVNNQTKLLWECSRGHRWEAVCTYIKQGRWCPYCAGTRKRTTRTIEDMKNLAAQRGGKCLSPSYLDAHARLMWQCEQGHKWMAEPTNIQQGIWCPVCGHRRGGRRRKAP